MITKDITRNDLDQSAKKSTVEQGRGHSALTKRQEGRGYSPLTKRQGRRGNSPQTKRQEGRGYSALTKIEQGRRYRPQKDKDNRGGNKLKSYPLRSRFPSKTESWKRLIAVLCHHQLDRMP